MDEQLKRGRWQIPGEWDIHTIMSGYEPYCMVKGSPTKINGVAALNNAGPDDLAFCSLEGEPAISAIGGSDAGIILCTKSVAGLVGPKPTQQLVFLQNPRFAFVHFVNSVLRGGHENQKKQMTLSFTMVHESAIIGNNCKIGDYVSIGPDCILGNNVTLDQRVTLVKNCTIGSNSIIQPGAVLGADGFAFERRSDGSLERFPHFGRVIVGENVEISSNCSIARGSLVDTIIGDGTKLDALVHIAHNTTIGRNCQLAAGAIIGGSSNIGDSCWIGLNSDVKDHVKMGNNVLVASGASVVRDVSDGDVVAGVPAKSIKEKVSTKDLFIMIGKSRI